MTGLPAPPLRGYVEAYLGYRAVGFAPGLQRRLPSRHMTFAVGIGAPVQVREPTDATGRSLRYRCVIGGLQATAATIAHGGYQEGVAICLSPLGSRAVLGMPAAALWDQSLEAVELLGPMGEELWERLQHAATWPQRFDVCDQVLLRNLHDRGVARPLAHAWRAVVAAGGRLSVARLADRTAYSRQHFTTLFRREFGPGPKLASRIVRLERAQHALLRLRSSTTIAEVAASCGYADQAHLSRDFASLAGCSPSTWLAEELPILQDPVAASR